eukprot:CAMPEP_0170484150 /NCGR_PEP_ID=MMETSP0208-20121228/3689_1 /TAXON_ID=197538 /ORGANISM="Strombidium inclinatum, Strain S3" /LENGTH=122 /DNA_ID=CAMNT_0010757423 /DNA_START=175 /DNA_END=543 /DNA_ORIENTATION=+
MKLDEIEECMNDENGDLYPETWLQMYKIDLGDNEVVDLFEMITKDNYMNMLTMIMKEGMQFKKFNFFKAMLMKLTERVEKNITEDLRKLTLKIYDQTYEEMIELCEHIAANKHKDMSHLIPN